MGRRRVVRDGEIDIEVTPVLSQASRLRSWENRRVCWELASVTEMKAASRAPCSTDQHARDERVSVLRQVVNNPFAELNR